jgi:hypothetical protein
MQQIAFLALLDLPFVPEDGDNVFLLKVGKIIRDYKEPH